MDKQEQELLKLLILNQDIEYYHSYLEHLKSEFTLETPEKQADLMNLYHAAESVWTALLNLKSIVDKI